MKLYPLVFSFRDLVAGNGFVAAVAMDGHVLLSEEEEGLWMYGVQPGGIAAGGRERQFAQDEFKKGYLAVLFEYASSSTSFKEFEAKVQSFFDEANDPNVTQWQEAVAAVRRENLSLSGLPTVKAEAHVPRLMIQEMGRTTANSGVNTFDVVAVAEGPGPLREAA